MALVKGKRRITKSPKAESVVTPEPEVIEDEEVIEGEPEVIEDETATGGALVKVKGTLTDFAEAERVVTRTPEVLEDGTVTGGILKSIVYTVVTGSGKEATSDDFSESEFYRKYETVNHSADKKLTSEG